MRRSTAITLTLLAGTGLMVADCDTDPDTEGVLETTAACVDRLGAAAASECDAVFRSAMMTHEATAPRFGSAETCNTETGSVCIPLELVPGATGSTPWAANAAAVFIPMMAGVMIGRALSDDTRGAAPVYSGRPPPACPPGAPGNNTCGATSAGSTGGGGGGGSGARRYWYSGTSYAGVSDSDARSGFQRASISVQGDGLLSRGAGTASTFSRAGSTASRAGGLGFSAAAHAGGGS